MRMMAFNPHYHRVKIAAHNAMVSISKDTPATGH
jgi:hypothetical protein